MKVFFTENIHEKIKQLSPDIQEAFNLDGLQKKLVFPVQPLRDATVLDPKFHPTKRDLSRQERRARLLHDLASIELQAMELALRTLLEFPEAPIQFREQLAALTLSEGEHLRLCLDGIERLGFKWGDWPVHCALWKAVSNEDSLLDRILIVHRYLEGSGLEAGSSFLRRLSISEDPSTFKILKKINDDELDHVLFGSYWFKELCRANGSDPDVDFKQRIEKLRLRLPRRLERINQALRQKAGFSVGEIQVIEDLRQSFIQGD